MSPHRYSLARFVVVPTCLGGIRDLSLRKVVLALRCTGIDDIRYHLLNSVNNTETCSKNTSIFVVMDCVTQSTIVQFCEHILRIKLPKTKDSVEKRPTGQMSTITSSKYLESTSAWRVQPCHILVCALSTTSLPHVADPFTLLKCRGQVPTAPANRFSPATKADPTRRTRNFLVRLLLRSTPRPPPEVLNESNPALHSPRRRLALRAS